MAGDEHDDDATPEVVDLPETRLPLALAPARAAGKRPIDPVAREMSRALEIVAKLGRRLNRWFGKRTLGEEKAECPTCKGPASRLPTVDEALVLREYSAAVQRLAAEQRHRLELVHKYKLKPVMTHAELTAKLRMIIRAEVVAMSDDQLTSLLEERLRARQVTA